MISIPMSSIVIAIAGLIGLIIALTLFFNWGGVGTILANATINEANKIISALTSAKFSFKTPIPGVDVPLN